VHGKLKIIRYLSVFIVFSLGVVYADVSYGLKGGILYSSFSGSHSSLGNLENYEHKVRIGPQFGGFLHISKEKMLGIQPELLITLKGEKYWNENTEDKLRISLYYIEIPLFFTVTYPLPTPLYIAPKIFTGPYFGFHIRAGGDTEDIGINAGVVDYGVIIGIGINVQKITFEIQYGIGMASVSESLEFGTKAIIVGYTLN
jgi:hypothetical protein